MSTTEALPELPKAAAYIDQSGECSPSINCHVYTADQMRDYARAALAAAAPSPAPAGGAEPVAVPEGWKLVPVEPTREMMEAMPRMPALRAELLPFRDAGWSLNAITNRERWAAAIKAAPATPQSWIDVNDQKPEKFQEVLIAFAGQCSIASTGQYTDSPHDHGGWCYPAENHGANDAGEGWPTVTHWRPLPEVPGAAAPTAQPQPVTEFMRAALNVEHSLLHDGPGDVVIALRERLLPVLAGVLEDCGYLPDLQRAAQPQPQPEPSQEFNRGWDAAIEAHRLPHGAERRQDHDWRPRELQEEHGEVTLPFAEFRRLVAAQPERLPYVSALDPVMQEINASAAQPEAPAEPRCTYKCEAYPACGCFEPSAVADALAAITHVLDCLLRDSADEIEAAMLDRAAGRLHALATPAESVTVYLKDGETVTECLARNQADVVSALGLLADARQELAALKAQADVAQQPAELTHTQLHDIIGEHLTSAYCCTRVWDAWNVGTMSRDDFTPLADTDFQNELADAILKAQGGSQ